MHLLIDSPPASAAQRSRREPLGGEQGVAMIIAMLVMATMLVLIAGVVTGSVHLSTATRRKTNFTRALGPAEAGARAAVYRLNATGATATQCFTTVGVAESDGSCPAYTEDLGNGANFSYYVSPVLSSSSACVGSFVTAVKAVEQRCVTSIGHVNGVLQRVQERIVGYTPSSESAFPFAGILALNGFNSNNVVSVTGNIGSNGPIEMTNGGVKITGKLQYWEGTSAPSVAQNACTGTCSIEKVAKIAVPKPSAATEAEFIKAETTNNNEAVAWPTMSEGNIYTSSTRTVKTPGELASTLYFPSGTYSFCNMEFNGKATLSTSGSGPVVIYIGSPACLSAGRKGHLIAANEFKFLNPSGKPNNLQFYFWGHPPCTTSCEEDITFNNAEGSSSEPLTATIFAPYSTLRSANAMYMDGGMVVATDNVNNALYFNTTGLVTGSSEASGSKTAYFPSAFELCTSAESTTGC